MKILMIMPHAPVASYWPAHGIMYVSSYLKSKGYDDIQTLNLSHYAEDKAEKVIRQNEFDAICTGGLFTYMKEFRRILNLAKEYSPHAKTILGGPIATAHPEFALSALEADYLVLGEGEETTLDLLEALGNGTDLEAVKGIAYQNNGHCRITQHRTPIKDLDSLPFPDYEGFEYGYYLDNFSHPRNSDASYLLGKVRTGGVIGGRDCPGKCTFCFRITGGLLRVRSVDNVIDEICYLIENYQVNNVIILDDVFAINKSRVFEFCKKIKPFDVPWRCQLRVPGVNEELLMAMKEAGCYLVSYGFESGSDTVLRSMKKGINVKQIENVIPLTRKSKMTLQANFIFGDPAETLDTAAETLRLVRKYNWLNVGLSYIKPFPGSPLYCDLIKENAIKNLEHFWINSAYDEDGRLINMTKMSDDEMMLLRVWVYLARFDRFYFKLHKVEKNEKGEYLLSITCPFCKNTSHDLKIRKSALLMCPSCYLRAHLDPLDLAGLSRPVKFLKKMKRQSVMGAIRVLTTNKTFGLLAVKGYRLLGRTINVTELDR